MLDEAEVVESLRALYRKVDGLLAGFGCDSSTECCRFGVTGREPYPTSAEVLELERAVAARGGVPRSAATKKRSLLALEEREGRCGLLTAAGTCAVYASRPFGCRTFFCDRAKGPAGADVRSIPREEVARIGREIAELSERFTPHDSGPRPLSRVVASWKSRR